MRAVSSPTMKPVVVKIPVPIMFDTTMAVAESLYTEFKEQLYAPPPLLSRMVEAGLLGRKAGEPVAATGGNFVRSKLTLT